MMSRSGGMMSDDKKKILKANFQKIVQNMADVENVLDHLHQDKIISANFMETVLSKPTRSEKTRELMLNLHRYGENAFHALLLALEETGQIELALQISPNYRGQDGVDSDTKEIDDIGRYTFESLEIRPLLKAEIYRILSDNLSKNCSSFAKSMKTMIKNNYKINNPLEIGRAVIINNKDFDFYDTREGSDVDLELVVACLERLKFQVKVHRDLTFTRILEVLHAEQTELEESDRSTDIFVVVVMSHGAKDYIYGTDGCQDINLVSLDKIQEIFDSDNCKSLVEKPKLFFIQACQRDMVIPSDEGVNKIKFRNVATRNPPKTSMLKTHKSSDIFFMISTVPGYLSWRHPLKGSFFIRTLVYALATKCHNQDFLSIMTDVQRLLTGIEIETPSEKIVQQPELRSTLRKKLYFLP